MFLWNVRDFSYYCSQYDHYDAIPVLSAADADALCQPVGISWYCEE